MGQGLKKERMLVEQKPWSKGWSDKGPIILENNWNIMSWQYEANTPQQEGNMIDDEPTHPLRIFKRPWVNKIFKHLSQGEIKRWEAKQENWG
jgi:hypothetical protein